jgi:prolyl oligopeptidase
MYVLPETQHAFDVSVFQPKLIPLLSFHPFSQGGLLMGNMYTMRPDLFGAIHCAVPLLDMQRYHTLLAGASWMAEYGNPDTEDWQYLKSYSPYHST